jgi:RHS repeat-associated protein
MLDRNNHLTKYSYGDFGLLKEVIDPENKTESYKYDLNLNCIMHRDKKGNTINYKYDNRNLLLSKENAVTNDKIEYEYDEVGNRIGMTDETGSTEYIYDRIYRIRNIQKDNVDELSYSYDRVGNIKRTVDKLNNETYYEYDDLNRLEIVSYKVDGKTNIVEYSYDINGNKGNISYDSGVNIAYEYDKNNKPIKVINKQNSQIISQYSYEYDLLGRRISATDQYGTTRYDYDNKGRLQSVDSPRKNESYTFDNVGNIIQIVEELREGNDTTTKVTTMTYSPGNRLLSKSLNQGDTAQSISQPILEFDGFDRLKRVINNVDGKEKAVEYKYNGDDLRTQKTIKNAGVEVDATNYLHNRGSVILATDKQNNLKERYIKGLDYIARIDNDRNYANYLYNGHGDVVQLVNQAGQIDNSYHYDSFGNFLEEKESYANEIRYAGEFYDKEAGMYYLRARFYDPRDRRFVSEDSYWGQENNPLSLNRYTYCHNDPVNFIDPSGHWIKSDYELKKKEQDKIIEATDHWYDAKNNREKKYWHEKATEIREKARRERGHEYTDDHDVNLDHMKYADATRDKWRKRTRKKVNNRRYKINRAREEMSKEEIFFTNYEKKADYGGAGAISKYIVDGVDLSQYRYLYNIIMTKYDGKAPWHGYKLKKSEKLMTEEELFEHLNRSYTEDPIVLGSSPGAWTNIDKTVPWQSFTPEDVVKFMEAYEVYGNALQTSLMISVSAGDYAKNIKPINSSKPKADYSEVYRKYGGETGEGDWIHNKGYKPKEGERTLEGFINNNVSIDKEIPLHTNSPGFNNNPRGTGGQFKRFGTDSHGGVKPHVHQPTRNSAPNGNIYGGTGSKTTNGGVTSPTTKDIKQLYDYLFNGKYRP